MSEHLVAMLVVALLSSASAPAAAPVPGPQAGTKAAEGAGSFIDLSEIRFDDACGEVSAQVIDPDSSSPRLILSGRCGATAFDVVAHPKRLPDKLAPDRVRFVDVATGQERIATEASLEVTQFGPVGQPVAGRMRFVVPGGLNKPDKAFAGTFRLVRGADRHSP